ncbi:hypothetical protein [Fulvivirga sedimenti]|uniref:Uncharacterized protein n=1 Tax=Fulvivirga sedimenti TaxID=2879465 RepID=A0A9X1HKM1_9BACT|nr:hypothetical protein [Fulvivirga sedimenti]MCA6073989.1 hypothetical protein [Fulvivirga sedimenti]
MDSIIDLGTVLVLAITLIVNYLAFKSLNRRNVSEALPFFVFVEDKLKPEPNQSPFGSSEYFYENKGKWAFDLIIIVELAEKQIDTNKILFTYSKDVIPSNLPPRKAFQIYCSSINVPTNGTFSIEIFQYKDLEEFYNESFEFKLYFTDAYSNCYEQYLHLTPIMRAFNPEPPVRIRSTIYRQKFQEAIEIESAHRSKFDTDRMYGRMHRMRNRLFS